MITTLIIKIIIYIFILFRRLYNKSQAYDFFKIKNLVIFKIYSSLVIEI